MQQRLDIPRSWPARILTFITLITVVASGAVDRTSSASELRRTPIVLAVEKARPSVVNIQGRKTVRSDQLDSGGDQFRQVNGMGTGIIVDQRGYILTNFHVVENVQQIQVTTAQRDTYVGRLIAHDPVTDLAVIKIDTPNALPVIDFGVSSDLMPGEPVIAVGNAFGYEHTVTRGIISALHREVQVSVQQKYRDLIQTDASINPGNSGGPLLNIDGQMIGINVAVRVGAQGIGFAIPVDEAMETAATLLNVERIDRVVHGVIGETDQQDSARLFVVRKVRERSAAERAGLQAGDNVVSVGQTPIHRALDFERALLGAETNEPLTLTVLRNGQTHTMELVLPQPAKSPSTFDDQTWLAFGLKLAPVPEREFRKLQSMYHGGLRVLAVRPTSPANQQGIRSGDILVGMHVWETVSKENVRYILKHDKFEDFQPIKFYILRGAETLYGHMRIEREPVMQASRSVNRN